MKSTCGAKVSLRGIWKAIRRCTDAVLFGGMLSASVLLLVPHAKLSWMAWLALTAAFMPLLLLFDCRTEANRKRKERERIVQTIRTEKLLMMEDAQIRQAIGAGRIVCIRSLVPQKHEILQAIAQRPDVLICMGDGREAAALLRAYRKDARLINEAELLRLMQPDVSEEEIARRFEKTRGKPSVRTFLRRIMHVPVNRYLLLGTLLLVLSFLGRYKIYYRLLSSACLLFGGIKGVLGREKVMKKFRFFLDNMDG